MHLATIHNPVFNFTVARLADGEYDFSLKYKGTEIDITDSEYDNDEFVTELNQSPEEFLDFEAKHYPDRLKFKFTFQPAILNGTCSIVDVSKKDDTILIEYMIAFIGDDILTMKYNPFRIFKTIFAKANKNGMNAIDTIDDEESTLFDNINYPVPAKGNLAVHYRKGINILETIYADVLREMEQL